MAAKKKSVPKKKTASARPASRAKKAPAKRNAPARKAAAKKAAAKKTPAKKAPAKKVAAKRAPAKKAATKKTPTKKTPTKKAAVKKAPARKAVAKKAPSRKRPAPKPVAKAAAKAPAQPAARGRGAASGRRAPAKLSAKEVAEFRNLLLSLRDRINNDLEFMSGDHRNRSEWSEGGGNTPSADTVDQGSDAFDREFMMTLMSSEQDIIYEIQEALRRIDAGTYGICEISGEPIERERLKVIPYARHSVRVQTELEKGRGFRRRNGGVRIPAGFAFESEGDGE